MRVVIIANTSVFRYDQAQIISTALDFSCLPNLPTPESRKICLDLAADLLEYTARDLRSPSGGFLSAEDADSAESFEDLHHTTGESGTPGDFP